MVEIEFSYGLWETDDLTVRAQVQEFSETTGIKVRLRVLDWSTAWVDLFTMVSQGEGSDVSNIGSTWVSTLAKMDALRAFTPEEIGQMGGGESFVRASWQSTKLLGDQRVWAIPSLGWLYVIFYRKDLLQSVGIDPLQAFQSPQAVQNTLLALQKSTLEIPFLIPNIPHPYVQLLHMAAPWVWAAGGEFISPAGNKVLFDSSLAIAGFVNWLNTYRSVDKEQYQFLDAADVSDLVRAGRVAAGMMDIRIANEILSSKVLNIKKDNIGFASPTNIPWVGGGSYVIWQHTQFHPDRERAAVKLVKFLSTSQSQMRTLQADNLLPLHLSAIEESYPPGNPLREPVMQAVQQGRSY